MEVTRQGKSAQKSKARATELVYQYGQRLANCSGRSEMESRLRGLQTGRYTGMHSLQTTVILI